MDIMEAMRQRHSYRSFTDEPVDRALLERVLNAARLAPSAMNAQPWRFHVATGTTRQRVAEVMQQTTVYLDDYLANMGMNDRIEAATKFATDLGDAPVVMAMSIPRSDNEMAALNNTLSAGAALENLLLAATAYGLGTCSITFSYWVRDELAQALEVPADEMIVALIVLGHPSGRPSAPPHEADVVIWHE
jgi:nitroreductase